MIRAALLTTAGALALAGCATNRVTLLPPEPGQREGAIAVLDSGSDETVLDRANTQAILRKGGARVRSVSTVDPAALAVMGTLPPQPAIFSMTFPIGEFSLSESQLAVLDTIRAEVAQRPGAQIEVAGFTDSTGGDVGNDELSRKRAEAVAAQLRDFGFSIGEADAVGRGEDEARATMGDEVSAEQFRRVDVIVR